MHVFLPSLILGAVPLAYSWSTALGHAEVLGVAADGSAWAVRLVLPRDEVDTTEVQCAYPAVGGIEPGSVTLALCRKDANCQSWTIYDLDPCTAHEDAAKQLNAAKAAWTAASVPWDHPVAALTNENDTWSLPDGTLAHLGISGTARLTEQQQTLPDGEIEQRLVIETTGGKSAAVPITRYPAGTGAMGWVFLDRVFYLPVANVVFGFLGGANGGADYTATDPVVVDLAAVAGGLRAD